MGKSSVILVSANPFSFRYANLSGGESPMIEIRWHGRGGQGAVTSVEMMALAAIEAGKYAQGFPAFGPERRGAPVMAFNRVSDKPIKIRSGIYRPDVVVVLDPSLVSLVPVTDGLKPDGTLIVNTSKTAAEIRKAPQLQGEARHRRCHAHRPGGARGSHCEHDHAGRRPQGDGRPENGFHEVAPRAPFRPGGGEEHVRHEAGLQRSQAGKSRVIHARS